jgi:hypothetical protein
MKKTFTEVTRLSEIKKVLMFKRKQFEEMLKEFFRRADQFLISNQSQAKTILTKQENSMELMTLVNQTLTM